VLLCAFLSLLLWYPQDLPSFAPPHVVSHHQRTHHHLAVYPATCLHSRCSSSSALVSDLGISDSGSRTGPWHRLYSPQSVTHPIASALQSSVSDPAYASMSVISRLSMHICMRYGVSTVIPLHRDSPPALHPLDSHSFPLTDNRVIPSRTPACLLHAAAKPLSGLRSGS
jgi:hypothetical protein